MRPQKSSEVERTILYQNDSFEIVSIHWSIETKSPLHNHGWSQCQVLVQEGVFENTLQAGVKKEIRVLEVGQVLSTPVGASHEMRCLTPTGKTLHVYTPKISVHKEEDRKFNPTIDPDLLGSLSLGEGVRFEQLTEILKSIEEDSISTHSPYFMNQLFSGIHPQTLLSEEVIARTKTTMATEEASAVFSKVEIEVINQLCSLIGWRDSERDGVCVPGGSSANFMALQLAKQKKCPETKTEGLAGKSFKILVSSDAHYSFQKAAIAMGFGTKAIVQVEKDSTGRMNPHLLSNAINLVKLNGHIPLLVCATAGTTVFGAFDHIEEIHNVCKEHGVWLHVDGAWGGPALFSEKTKSLLKGIELADSVTFDAHKLFGASLTCSFILTRHKNLLLEANDVSGADYLFHDNSESVDRGKMSWQCGRRADALSFWSIWKNLGTDGLGSFVERLFFERDKTLEWIGGQKRLQVVQEPTYLNLCVRILTPDFSADPNWSKTVRERLKKQNLVMVNYSVDENGTFLRIILAHPQVTSSHIIEILKMALDVSC